MQCPTVCLLEQTHVYTFISFDILYTNYIYMKIQGDYFGLGQLKN